jgi:hypothetical protein
VVVTRLILRREPPRFVAYRLLTSGLGGGGSILLDGCFNNVYILQSYIDGNDDMGLKTNRLLDKHDTG